ncbi:MAG: hypothetical protein WDW38_006173 [Sanguina aurantia]
MSISLAQYTHACHTGVRLNTKGVRSPDHSRRGSYATEPPALPAAPRRPPASIVRPSDSISLSTTDGATSQAWLPSVMVSFDSFGAIAATDSASCCSWAGCSAAGSRA